MNQDFLDGWHIKKGDQLECMGDVVGRLRPDVVYWAFAESPPGNPLVCVRTGPGPGHGQWHSKRWFRPWVDPDRQVMADAAAEYEEAMLGQEILNGGG